MSDINVQRPGDINVLTDKGYAEKFVQNGDGSIIPYAAAATNANRAAAVVHRSAITVVDKLGVVGTITLTGQTGGSLATSTTYYVSAAAYNRYGSSGAAAIVSLATGTNTTLRAAFSAVTGATFYDLFLSTASTGPLWVGRITAAQLTSGIVINGVGTTTTGGAAGSVDIRVVGTGLASSVAPFTANNAYTPDSITALSCAGKSVAHIKTLLAVTDLRSLPALTIMPFLVNASDGFYDQCQLVNVPLLVTTGQALRQDYMMQVDGSTNLVIAIDTLSGQGAAATIVVELA